MASHDEPPREMPRAVVEDFLEREAGTRAFLDELRKLTAEGRHAETRDRLRGFAEGSRGAFFAVALSLAGNAQFFADAEAQMDAAVGEKLRDLEESYGVLEEEFALVRSEQTQGRLNPVTNLSASASYRADEEVPLVSYAPLSNEVELFESRQSPAETLQVAELLVKATTDALSTALENEQTVNTQELSALIDRREDLEYELGTLRTRIDELRRTPAED